MDNVQLLNILLVVSGLFSVTNALECHCTGCDTASCHVTSGACYLSTKSPHKLVTGCLPDYLTSIKCDQSDDNFRCCHDNQCNKPSNKERVLRSASKGGLPQDTLQAPVIIVVSLVAMTIIASLLATTVCCVAHERNLRKAGQRVSVETPPPPVVRTQSHNQGNLKACVAIPPQSETLARLTQGRDHPLSPMLQRSIVQQTILEKSLYKGVWSHKYQGRWRHDRVSVKVFNSRQVKYWYNEKHILQLPVMYHENITRFVAAEMVQKHSQNFYYLISEHHLRGTLRDHLGKAAIEVTHLSDLVISLLNGVDYLHSDVSGGVAKQAIAHRNITSASIQINNSGCCCISDFEIAVNSATDLSSHSLTTPTDPRYMAPEILSKDQSHLDFEGLVKTDIYSLGLVLWEIAQCTSVRGRECDYSLPFSDLLTANQATPTKQEMNQLVCVEGRRPHLPDQCHLDQITQALLNVIESCWTCLPSERPITLKLKQILQNSFAPKPVYFDKNNQPVF